MIYLFESKTGVYYKPTSIQRYFLKLSKKIGKRITPHLLRHSFVTNHLNNKTDIKVLSEVTGASPKTLLETYHHSKINKIQFLKTSTKGTIYANANSI
jgi:site-specific recombinase XerD